MMLEHGNQSGGFPRLISTILGRGFTTEDTFDTVTIF